ncbi:hypothetical protein K435DRAFT_788154 [Dendrothele bispora CBS 962.96]|uniref:CSN8/PSMD8/EIF3K domain-containing protein n=1 Tax=Dendrothele bispora (strain CBS 962.96) TaxID=1314807 RepID=A0A4S8MZ33_DENBC|nr:hypothetical protein K435DRAFT_788154 [Dendrothele bispora CBS 962.96]
MATDQLEQNTTELPQSLSESQNQTQEGTQEDPYQLIFPEILNCVTQKDFRKAASIAETTDINNESTRLSRILVITPIVLAYLISDELSLARLVMKRLPPHLPNALVQGLGRLLQAVSARDYPNVYAHAHALVALTEQPDFPDPSLASVIKTMTEAFLESFRHRTFILLSRAYTSISLPLAQSYFGLPAESLLEVATANQWTYNASSQILTPIPYKAPKSLQIPSSSVPITSSLANLNFIASSVSKLEM